MPDSGFTLPPTGRVIDAASAAIAGGSLEFYVAGTNTPLTVYSNAALTSSLGSVVYLDSGGHPVASSGSSTKVLIYTGAALFKMVVKDSAGVVQATYHDVKATEDTSALGGGGGDAAAVAGVLSKTADYTLLATDEGKWVNADPTGATFTITLPNAVTVGDGWACGIRHSGGLTTTNAVRVATVGGQTIASDGLTGLAAMALDKAGESVWLVSDGGGWTVIVHTPPHMVTGSTTMITVADRLSQPPASPSIGALYIIEGAPAGAWVGFAQHDVIQIVGSTSYRKWTPPTDCGWMAYVQAEDVLTQFRASAWVDLTNMTAPNVSAIKRAIFADQRADGTNGGGVTTGSWLQRTLQTTISNTIDGANLAGNVITLPTGNYLVFATAFQQRTNGAGLRIKQGASTFHYAINAGSAADTLSIPVMAPITVAGGSDTIELQYYAQSSTGSTDLGAPLLIAGNLETYALVTVIDLSSLQGPTGQRGPQGSIAATPSGALTLANGANANVVIGTNQKVRITGPTGSFSINGFVAPANDGYVLIVYNPLAQTMTLTNDATSTAANRILTMTGSDVALTGPSMATLIYDTTDARWILQSTQG